MDDKTRKELAQAAVAIVASYLAAKAQAKVFRAGWEPPAASAFWHRIMRASQGVARRAGHLALYAETRYRATL